MNEKEVDDEKLLLKDKEKKEEGQTGEGQEEVEKEVEEEVEEVIEVTGRGPLKVRTNEHQPSFDISCAMYACLV